jgi:hypothetical protein
VRLAVAHSATYAGWRITALALVDLYRQIAQGIAADHGVPYPAELDRLISARLRAGPVS